MGFHSLGGAPMEVRSMVSATEQGVQAVRELNVYLEPFGWGTVSLAVVAKAVARGVSRWRTTTGAPVDDVPIIGPDGKVIRTVRRDHEAE